MIHYLNSFNIVLLFFICILSGALIKTVLNGIELNHQLRAVYLNLSAVRDTPDSQRQKPRTHSTKAESALISDANLFHPLRKDYSVSVLAACEPESNTLETSSLRLSGIIITSEVTQATITVEQQGFSTTERVTIGDRLDDAVVTNITPTCVYLKKNSGEELTLDLYPDQRMFATREESIHSTESSLFDAKGVSNVSHNTMEETSQSSLPMKSTIQINAIPRPLLGFH